MDDHIKILGVLHVILGGMGILASIAIFLLFGGLAGLAGVADTTGLAIPVLGGIGGLIAIIVMVFALPGFIGGIGLLMLAPWSRVFMIVISALHLLHIPFGTALGIYGLWALTRPETEAVFNRRRLGSTVPAAR